MQVTKEGIETIKAGNSLADIVTERGITLKRKGRTLVASCPFHEEKTPSFTVTPTKGLFHCFGCGVAGDVIGFVTRHDGVSFANAMEGLAQRAGLDMKKLMKPPPVLLCSACPSSSQLWNRVEASLAMHLEMVSLSQA